MKNLNQSRTLAAQLLLAGLLLDIGGSALAEVRYVDANSTNAAGYFIRFSGVPGSAHWLPRAPGLRGPWTAIGPQTAAASGLVEFWDRFPPPGQGFYRSMQP